MSYRVTFPVVLAFLSVSLSGCEPFAAPESMLDEYVTRVARVFDGDSRLTPVPTVAQLPRRRERVRDIPPLDVSMLDFLSLYGCELQHVVGERNSILGRVMHPAGLLDYEVRFVRAADECVETIKGERLAARILEVAELKRASMADVVWNAIWGSSEIENFLTRSRGPLAVAHDRDMASTMSADLKMLERMVERILSDDREVDVKALDPVYQRWEARSLAGQVIRSAALVVARLDDASRLIEMRLEGRPMCAKPGLRTRSAERMQGMFLSVYIGHVQPYLADVDRVRRELMPSLQALARIGDASRSPAVTDYARTVLSGSASGSLWREFDRAVKRHTLAWQHILEQCGMRPGQHAD